MCWASPRSAGPGDEGRDVNTGGQLPRSVSQWEHTPTWAAQHPLTRPCPACPGPLIPPVCPHLPRYNRNSAPVSCWPAEQGHVSNSGTAGMWRRADETRSSHRGTPLPQELLASRQAYSRAPLLLCSPALPLTVVPRMTKLCASRCPCQNSSISCKGNSEHTSALRTKKASAPPDRIWSRK